MSHTGNASMASQLEVMELTAASQRDRLGHQAMLLDLEAKKRAFQVDVPTLPHDVRNTLRNLGLPVRLFGENLANVRDRLRMELARREIMQERGIQEEFVETEGEARKPAPIVEEEDVTKYSRATNELIHARELFAKYSILRSKERLNKERNYRVQWQRKRVRLTSFEDGDSVKPEEYAEVDRLDAECLQVYKSLRKLGLEGSQYGDSRPISSLAASHHNISQIPLVATGSWSGTIKLWNGSSPELTLVGQKNMGHEDRIMGIALRPEEVASHNTILATASIDLTSKLWKIQAKESALSDDDNENSFIFSVKQTAHLKGHAARLCSVAFHPQGEYVATTSFDHTWRLWDVATGSEILLQDGHWKEVYGIGFHLDGSLCSTTDFGGVVQVWDLRTGKSISHFLGHAKRVLCAEFSMNGFQLATAGDDGTIKIWDLRKRKQFASVPAHSNLITQLKFDRHHNGEYLASSSFDGTAKLWSTRDWKLLACARGHEGKVMGVDLLKESMVTCGFDKTIKLWR